MCFYLIGWCVVHSMYSGPGMECFSLHCNHYGQHLSVIAMYVGCAYFCD